MKQSMYLILFSAVFILCGCTAVTSLTPVGTKPVVTEKKDWEGVWYNGDGLLCFIRVKDKNKGILRVAMLNGGKEGKEDIDFSLKKFDVHIKQGKSLKFANFLCRDVFEKKEINKSTEKAYCWFMITNSKENILLYIPNSKFYNKLITDKKLKGEEVDNCIIISDSSEKILEVIDSYGDQGQLFNWKEPIPLRRLIHNQSD